MAGHDKEVRYWDQKIKNLEKDEKPDSKAIAEATESRKNQIEKKNKRRRHSKRKRCPICSIRRPSPRRATCGGRTGASGSLSFRRSF